MGPLDREAEAGRTSDAGYLALDVLVLLAVVLLGFLAVFESLSGALSAASRHLERIEEAIEARNELPQTPPDVQR